jgi:hypothetical protein
MKIKIDGKELDLQGLEGDSVVILRPEYRLNKDEFDLFCKQIKNLSEVFSRHNMSLIIANAGECTFEVLKAKGRA